MNTATPQTQDFWTLLHDLVFGVPHPVLIAFEFAAALLVIATLLASASRIWRGDRFELGAFKLERTEAVRDLQSTLDEISKDDRLKKNVLWMFRDRINEANRIVRDGVSDPAVRSWCGDVLTDVATALSRGGHDRHRTSLWIRAGDDLRMYHGNGFRQAAVDNASLPLGSIAGNVLQTGLAHNSSDIETDAGFFPKPRSGRPYQSLLAVPVKTPAAQTIAVLCVDAEARGYFDRDDEFFAGCFADLIALLVAQVVTGDAP